MSAQIENKIVEKKVVKKVTKKVVEAAPEKPVEKVAEPVKEEAKEEQAEGEKKRTRKAKETEPRKPVTGESVQTDMKDLIAFFAEQKAATTVDSKSTKILNQVKKRLARILQDLARVVKKSTKSTTPKDPAKVSSSGLMKPVEISERLSKFMNVPVGTNQSRVAVTNALCAYIKTKNLQNQANKRQILPDAELIELLGYTGDVAATPLTYFYIQQLIQKHFVKQVKA
jgi:chromatin remodeling complex protein RSC6